MSSLLWPIMNVMSEKGKGNRMIKPRWAAFTQQFATQHKWTIGAFLPLICNCVFTCHIKSQTIYSNRSEVADAAISQNGLSQWMTHTEVSLCGTLVKSLMLYAALGPCMHWTAEHQKIQWTKAAICCPFPQKTACFLNRQFWEARIPLGTSVGGSRQSWLSFSPPLDAATGIYKLCPTTPCAAHQLCMVACKELGHLPVFAVQRLQMTATECKLFFHWV